MTPTIDLLSLDNHPWRNFLDKKIKKWLTKIHNQTIKDKVRKQELKHRSMKFIEKQFQILNNELLNNEEGKEKDLLLQTKTIINNLEIDWIGKDVYELKTYLKKELKRKEYISFANTIPLLNIITNNPVNQLETYPLIESIPLTKNTEENTNQMNAILVNNSNDTHPDKQQEDSDQFFREFRSLYATQIDAELSVDDIVAEIEDKELLDNFVDFIISSWISLKTNPQFKHEREKIYRNWMINTKRKLNEERFYWVKMQRLLLSQLQTKVLPSITINQDPIVTEDQSKYKTLYQLNPMIDLFIKYFPRLEVLFPNLSEQDETIPLGPKWNQPGLEDNVGILDQYIYKPRIDYADKRICKINPSNERHIKQRLPRKEWESHHDAVLRHKETKSKQRSNIVAWRTQHLINVPRVFTSLNTEQKKDQELLEEFRVIKRTYIKEDEPSYKGSALTGKQTIANEYRQKDKANYKCSWRPIKQSLRSKNNEIVFDHIFSNKESPFMYKFYMYRPEKYMYAFFTPANNPSKCWWDYYINQLLHENQEYILKMFQSKIEQLQKNNKHLLTRYYQSQTGIIDLINTVPVFKHKKIKIWTNQFIKKNDVNHPHFDQRNTEWEITNVVLKKQLEDALKYISLANIKQSDSATMNKTIALIISKTFNKILPRWSAIKIMSQPMWSYDPYNLPPEYNKSVYENLYWFIDRSEYAHIKSTEGLELYNFLKENPKVYYDTMTKYYIDNPDELFLNEDMYELKKEINSRLLFRADYWVKFRNVYAREWFYTQEQIYEIIKSNDITGNHRQWVDEHWDNVNDKTTFVLANKSIFEYNMKELMDYSDTFYPVELAAMNNYGLLEYYFPPHLLHTIDE